jgi:hypothetical protein
MLRDYSFISGNLRLQVSFTVSKTIIVLVDVIVEIIPSFSRRKSANDLLFE